jgi:nicotinamide-nucleotide amidase
MQAHIEALSAKLGLLLLRRQELVATAESCTGGLLAGAVTSIAGSSGWFDQGWVTYSNEAKHMQLGVTHACLEAFGAVSQETAREMAAGVLAMAPRATLSLTTTGIAGPGGGKPDKPVGLVWFGFGQRTAEGLVIQVVSRIFEGDRRAVREASVAFSLTSACQLLENT